MLKPIGIGTEFFHKLMENNCYYVDKTTFIRTVFQENQSDVLLITRPRRFGKTLTLTTFYDFLSLNPSQPGDVSRQERWFKDTAIYKDQRFCSNYMGKFPVVFISLKSVGGSEFARAYYQLACAVFDLYSTFSYLSASPNLSDAEKNIFKEIASDKNFICNVQNKDKVTDALSNLLKFLYKHHGIKPILLIDEYDVPIAKAAHNHYYREMLDIISPFLSNALKTNDSLGRAVLTGCLRAAKESIFTGLNNLKICSVLDTEKVKISRGIGFTEEETKKVLSYYGFKDDYFNEVKRYYGGYYFGTVHMYCPRDVMSFCDDNQEHINSGNNRIKAKNYWINTSGNDVIEEFMEFIRPEFICS